ncbi:hypothetical protein [Natronorubrum halophilum]|uniref:hypothetical protein n=1 Tax=Natronorubrum halophilum TaxID=1702106 RepID=UPI001EE92B79|nr:hypothetical protein [Natronorubrum halophilum]
MSVEHPYDDRTPASDEPMRGRHRTGVATAVEFHCPSAAGTSDAGTASSTGPPLHSRIERTRLRARIEALEQALETSEHRRQAVIDRYERLLTEQASSADDAPTTSETRSAVKRFLEAWQ